jgi:hypothetical protein
VVAGITGFNAPVVDHMNMIAKKSPASELPGYKSKKTQGPQSDPAPHSPKLWGGI